MIDERGLYAWLGMKLWLLFLLAPYKRWSFCANLNAANVTTRFNAVSPGCHQVQRKCEPMCVRTRKNDDHRSSITGSIDLPDYSFHFHTNPSRPHSSRKFRQRYTSSVAILDSQHHLYLQSIAHMHVP